MMGTRRVKSFLLFLVLVMFSLFLLVSCNQEVSATDSGELMSFANESEESGLVEVVIEVDKVTDSLISELKSQGINVIDYDESDVYGNVIYAVMDSSEIDELDYEVTESSERDYKISVLSDIVQESSGLSEQDANLISMSQITYDEESSVESPYIEEIIYEKFKEDDFVPIVIQYRIEEWENSEDHFEEISSDLGGEIQITSHGSMGMVAEISEKGLNLLQNKTYILTIHWRLSS